MYLRQFKYQNFIKIKRLVADFLISKSPNGEYSSSGIIL